MECKDRIEKIYLVDKKSKEGKELRDIFEGKKKDVMGLKELAEKYRTDKLEHGYIEYYEKLLPRYGGIDLLEFGCYKGASAKMWNDYFHEGVVATFDLFDENPIQNELDGIIAFKGDATYTKDLQQITPGWDVIIDDASHNSYDQQFTFLYSFIALLGNDSIYVIEDLHCCKDEFYWNRGVDKFEDTFLWVLQNWTPEKGFPVNKFFNGFYLNIINDLVKDVKLHDDKIAFIWKR